MFRGGQSSNHASHSKFTTSISVTPPGLLPMWWGVHGTHGMWLTMQQLKGVGYTNKHLVLTWNETAGLGIRWPVHPTSGGPIWLMSLQSMCMCTSQSFHSLQHTFATKPVKVTRCVHFSVWNSILHMTTRAITGNHMIGLELLWHSTQWRWVCLGKRWNTFWSHSQGW